MSLNIPVLGILGAMRVKVKGRKLGSRDHHCLSERDAGYGFSDRISRDLSIFPCFSNFLLFLMTLASRGARSASRDSKLSKTGQSGILDVFCDYLTAMTGVFSYGGRRPSQNFYLV